MEFAINAITLDAVYYRAGFIVGDDYGNQHTGPSWSATTNWPLLCKVSTGIYAGTANYTIPPYSGPDLQWQPVGYGSDGIMFTGAVCAMYSNSGPTIATFDFSSDSTLTNYVKSYIPFKVTWKYRTRATDTDPWGTFTTFGTTSNELYLCLADHAAGEIFSRTVVSNACRQPGAKTQPDALKNMFSAFKNIRTYDNRTLYYYQPLFGFVNNETPATAMELLQVGRGDCDAWTDLLNMCTSIHGFTGTKYIVSPAYSNDTHFLVNYLAFSSTPSCTNYPLHKWLMLFRCTAGQSMTPPFTNGVYGDMTQQPGIEGQNTTTPSEKVFGQHVVLKFSQDQSSYYDPSYKNKFASASAFETASVCGYGTNLIPYTLTNNPLAHYQMNVRPLLPGSVGVMVNVAQ